MKRVLILSLVLILFTGCATVQKVKDASLPTLTEIATPDNAKRALVIAQSLRVGYRDHIVRQVAADGVLSDDERKKLETFDHRDSIFTVAWSRAHTAVLIWDAGGDAIGDFNTNYVAIEQIANEWLASYGKLGGVQ